MSTAIVERDFSTAARKSAAKSGAAMPDGSYPIENTKDLKNAIQAIGRAKNPAAVKAHIRKRAKALGASELIPSDWAESYDLSKFGKSLLYEADGVTPASQSFDAIRSRVQAALDAARNAGQDMDLDGDNDAGYMGDCCYCWVMDIFPETVVYSMGGDLFQISYTDDGETVTLVGDPVEVERAYSVVSSDESTREVRRTIAIEAAQLQESSYDSSKGVLTLTVIKPGFSKNSTKMKESGRTLPRYYPAETLKRDHKIFNGSKMFLDHQTEGELKARPEGSVKDWVATLGETWAESDGTIMGTATVIDPSFKSKLDLLSKSGLLKEMGASVRIAASVEEGEAEGKDAAIVESIVSNKSVDFVTYAGAGGQCLTLESATEGDLDVLSLEELSERRPDLVELIESRARKENTDVKTLEQQLKEANEKVLTLTTERDDLKTKLAEADGPEVTPKKFKALQTENAKLVKENEELKEGQQKRDAASKLTEMLKASKLPEAAQKRLQERFKDAVSDEDFADAISEEREYVKTIAGPKGGVRNLGEGSAENADHQKDVVESFVAMGLTEDQAKIAAAGR